MRDVVCVRGVVCEGCGVCASVRCIDTSVAAPQSHD